MKIFYCLKINIRDGIKSSEIDKILGVEHNTFYPWELKIQKGETNIFYIDFFLDILENKYETLEEIGVTRNMISIWHYYEYDWQCNFEYSPLELKRLGDNGITLCVSCWDSGEEPEVYDENEDKILN